MIKRIYSGMCLWLILVIPAASFASEWQFEDVDRIVAISDIHGAYDAMVRTLQNAGVIAEDLAWSGGDTHLVIVGDILDRGPNSRDAMDLLIRLEGESAAAGGMVHVLIGNHEAMNLNGDLRYVSKQEYAAFAAEETAEEREHWFAAYVARSGGAGEMTLRSDFDARFPSGYFAHRRAFAIDGAYGKWLLEKPAIVVINGTEFVHGGLSPMVAELGLEGVNGKLVRGLASYVRAWGVLVDAGELLPTDNFQNYEGVLGAFMPGLNTSAETIAAVEAVTKHGNSALHAAAGPLWYRGNVSCGRLIEEDRLLASLHAIGAERVVIGHTPTPNRRVLQRMNGRVLEVDTGMLNNYYNGHGNALILEGDNVAAVGEDSTEILTPAQHPRRVGARPGGELSATDLENLLRSGDIVATREDDKDRIIVTVSDGNRHVEALFAERERRGFYPDVAAYRLDRLLELSLVPVAVVREVNGDDGSLQFLPDNWLDEKSRNSGGLGSAAQCGLQDQWAAMYVFDALIYNEGRSLNRMLYSPDVWQLILVGHERAFSTRKGKPRHLQAAPLDIGGAWHDALASLTAENLDERLGDVLNERRQRALLARRDELIR